MRPLLVPLVLALLPAAALAGPVEPAACAPPCGYIVPMLDLRIDDKPECGTGFLMAAGERPDDCEPLMADGASVAYTGAFTLYWEVSEDGHYLNDPADPIEVTFSGTEGNPDFLHVAVEPATFTLGTADLFAPQHMQTVGEPPDMQVWYRYEQPVTVTWTRQGDPTPEEAQKIARDDGIVKLFLRVKSDGSGETFREAFGVESFRFDAWAAPDGQNFQETKGAPWPLAVVVVALVLAAARRPVKPT